MTAILVTRPQAERDPVVGLLQERGYRVHAVPTVATVPIKIGLPDLERYDWIVVTSATGVLAGHFQVIDQSITTSFPASRMKMSCDSSISWPQAFSIMRWP